MPLLSRSLRSLPLLALLPPLLRLLHLLLFFLPSPRHTSPHRITSRADNFSLLGFPAVASPSLLSCRTATLPGSPSSSLAIYSVGPSSALMRTSFSNYVLLPPPLLILILRFLLHLLLVLVSFIFMQW